ncbi:hypothetical protein D3C87_945970 [compost metagenome]
MQLQDYLNRFWASKIDNHIIDLFNHYILFEVVALNHGTSSSHYLKFHQVKSFYYTNDQLPIMPEEDDYLELSSVVFEQEKSNKIELRFNGGENYRSSSMNFILEIWGREMLVESSSIEVDGMLFDIGDFE